jgi:DNA invertase Pin-like site-specific DNA recombinase
MNLRVSTKSQKEDGTSLATQEQRIREYAAMVGYEVVETLVISEDHTRTDLNRPGDRMSQASCGCRSIRRTTIP